MAYLEIKNLNVKYQLNGKKKTQPITVLENFACEFDADSINVIMGPSGCGKTTLLRAIAGLIDYEGDIFLNNQDFGNMKLKDRNISYVTQTFDLFPNMTVFDNIAFCLKNQGIGREEIISRVNSLAKELDIYYCLSRLPSQISGGQQQRVALARAIIKHPILYLFDEPLSNIDPVKKSQERMLIKKTIKAHRGTAIYVTHDLTEALSIGDKVFFMNEGKFIYSDYATNVMNSDNEYVKELIRSAYGKDTL